MKLVLICAIVAVLFVTVSAHHGGVKGGRGCAGNDKPNVTDANVNGGTPSDGSGVISVRRQPDPTDDAIDTRVEILDMTKN